MKTKVKVCCISSIEEAHTAIEYGASALGLVGPMPSGPGVIADELVREIAGKVPSVIDTFLLTSETKAEKIISHHHRTKTRTIQLVDSPEKGAYAILREKIPSIKIVQVIHVIDEGSVVEAIDICSSVDTLLLDSGNPNMQIKELGGTGRVHNWKLSRRIVESVNIPVFLAGGINPGNARRAIEEVGPYGLDLCSGVRTDGKLDKNKVEAFFKAII